MCIAVEREATPSSGAITINQRRIIAGSIFPCEAMITERHDNLAFYVLSVLYAETILVKMSQAVISALIGKVGPAFFLDVGTLHCAVYPSRLN